jgi:hypothetical protein
MPNPVIVNAAVEGMVDEAVARRLIAHVGGTVGSVYGKNGKADLHKKIKGYNNAARHAPWLVLVDLDDESCAPSLCQSWLPVPARYLCFRVAVRQVEAWLMADAEALADYLGVARGAIPDSPEMLENAKAEMIQLAAKSLRRDIRQDMAPREGSGRMVGPAYTSRLIEFTENHWRPERASQRAGSLRRSIACLERLVQ